MQMTSLKTRRFDGKLAPYKAIDQGSLGFWIPRHGFRILCQWNLDSGFQSLVGFRIPKPRILDSKSKNFLIPESVFPYIGRENARRKTTSAGTHRGALYYSINMIGPRSTFTISSTGVRFPIFVKCLWSWSTGCAPSAMLYTKHTITCSYCSYRTLRNSIFSIEVMSIQNRIYPLQGWNCSITGISVASNAIISWKMEFANLLPLCRKRSGPSCGQKGRKCYPLE